MQFNEIGDYNCGPSDIRYTPNWGKDCETCPGGFGMFQLTHFRDRNGIWRPPNCNELWSWKANARSGCGYLDYQQSVDVGTHQCAYTYTSEQRIIAFNQCGMCMYIPVEMLGNVIFEEGTNIVIDHAVALKRYNGLSGTGNREYVEWLVESQAWSFNRLNDLGFNYVEHEAPPV
jgi:hypothetical protein